MASLQSLIVSFKFFYQIQQVLTKVSMGQYTADFMLVQNKLL